MSEAAERDFAAIDAADITDRAIAWTVISAAFATTLNPQTLSALRDPHQLAEWPLKGPHFEAACHELGMSAALAATVETESELRFAHQRMMSGPGPVDPSPWESVHRSREGLVFDEETRQVRAAYREFGLQSKLLMKVPEDHVAIEAEFLAYLLSEALECIDRGESAQRFLAAYGAFLAEHAGQWLPRYFARFSETATTHYHRGIAGLGAQTIAAAAL